MRDLSNLLKSRRENMKKNFIVGILVGSVIAGSVIYFGYSTYALNTSKSSLVTPDISDCDSTGR